MLVLSNTTLIDGTGSPPKPNTTVKIKDGRIEAVGVPPGTQDTTLDLGGRTVIPGLINAHGHLMLELVPGAMDPAQPDADEVLRAVARARRILESGITTFRDMSGLRDLEFTIRRAIDGRLIDGPRLICSSKRLTMTGGWYGWIGHEVDGLQEVVGGVRKVRKAGAEVVKFVASGAPPVDPTGCQPGHCELTQEEMAAGVSEAVRMGLATAAHAVGAASIRNAVRAGIGSVEHGNYLDSGLVEEMLDRHTDYVPTLSVTNAFVEHAADMGHYPVAIEAAKRALDAGMHSIELALRDGLPMAMGTDAGTPWNDHDDMLTEFRLVCEAGQSVLGAIHSATVQAARVCRMDDVLGSVEAGKLADLVVLDGDPLSDLDAIGRPYLVVKGGEVVGRIPTGLSPLDHDSETLGRVNEDWITCGAMTAGARG